MSGLLDLGGRVALITGASQGIGWACAELLAAHGASVVLNYRDASVRPKQIAHLGPDAICIEADVSDREAIGRMFAAVDERLGRLDILVNNAGIYTRAPVEEVSEMLWDSTVSVNLKGAFFCAQEAIRRMRNDGTGRVINVSSLAAVSGPPRGAHYAATKGALISMTRSLARALGPRRIAVNAVAPGVTDTPQPALTPESRAAEASGIPWGRVATAQDVARAVLYLASDLSEYVTGQTLFVTGGLLAHGA